MQQQQQQSVLFAVTRRHLFQIIVRLGCWRENGGGLDVFHEDERGHARGIITGGGVVLAALLVLLRMYEHDWKLANKHFSRKTMKSSQYNTSYIEHSTV